LYILLWNKFKNNEIKIKKNIRSHTNTKNVLVFSASLGKLSTPFYGVKTIVFVFVPFESDYQLAPTYDCSH